MVLDHLKLGDEKFYYLHAAIVMPDHVHVILRPNDGFALSRIMKGIKGVTARSINALRNTTGQALWQAESWDRIPRSDLEFKEKLEYMLLNSLEAELTNDPWNYQWWYLNSSDSG